MKPERRPRSTYRLQLTPDFTFEDATWQLPYLAKLGVDWVYLSPILQSAEGSMHGYDVVDATKVDEARGGRDEFVKFAKAAHEHGLGVLVDIVPNHMGIAVPRENPWWWQVLAEGRDSERAHFFDIDWDAGDGKILVPVVGDADMPKSPGEPIANLAVDREAGVLRYWDAEFPLAAGSADDDADPREVHRRQHYRLVHWRLGDWDLNYRRFFTVTTLAGLRVEDADVWEAAHAEILSWIEEGLVDGLRIDHPDGLRDPRGYLERLRDRTGGVYLLVEKILEPGEELPADWETEGTTGYDALGALERVMVDEDGRVDLEQFAAQLTNEDPTNADVSTDAVEQWATLVHEMKRFVTDNSLLAELRRIARELAAAGVERDDTVDALAEIAAHFQVYRTYLPHGAELLEEAAANAREWRPDLSDAIEAILPILREPEAPAAKRFQQTTGMIMAKAVEDRSFYRYSRLTSLNEVGGDPSEFSVSLADFHELQRTRDRDWPDAQTALTTHDTKRSEDTRARIDAISEIPDYWAEAVGELLELAPISNPTFGNLLWQAVIGAWPASKQRLYDYATKAARESGEVTTWTAVDEEYEESLKRAIDLAFDHPAGRAIVTNLSDHITDAGRSNSLTMKAVQLLGPGVPDIYQGTELWDRSLVDPDNRRRVDWLSRRAALDAVVGGARPPIDDTGAAKLFIVATALRLRKQFELSTYEPLTATGASADHLIAFSRGPVVVLGTRLPIALADGDGWHDTRVELPEGEWVDELTGNTAHGSAAVAKLLAEYPVALLRLA